MPFNPLLKFIRQVRSQSTLMSRRSLSPAETRSPKRRKLEYPPLTPEDYKDGVMLAPMVRSGACEYTALRSARCSPVVCTAVPTRLFALKHGAKLVWGPEVVDKAILHAERVVDCASYYPSSFCTR